MGMNGYSGTARDSSAMTSHATVFQWIGTPSPSCFGAGEVGELDDITAMDNRKKLQKRWGGGEERGLG